MSYIVNIDGTILESCIEYVSFSIDDSRNSIIITGNIDTDEGTAILYKWALMPATNPECYKEISVEQYQKELLVRKVTFSKAFVIDYSENYSNYVGTGTFTLHIRQLLKKKIEVSSEESNKSVSNAVSKVSDKDEEVVETVQKTAVTTPALSVTKKSTKITDKISKKKNIGTRLPKSNGKWSGEEGNSAWIPDKDFVPPNKKTNPNKLSWSQISQKHGGVDRINFEDNIPDFTTISKGKVEIKDFGTDRNGENGNFKKADKKLAEQRGCTAREVKKWRKKNLYTWHEAEDCKTMYKVPNEIHGNVPHNGGISVAKKIKKERNVVFDE